MERFRILPNAKNLFQTNITFSKIVMAAQCQTGTTERQEEDPYNLSSSIQIPRWIGVFGKVMAPFEGIAG